MDISNKEKILFDKIIKHCEDTYEEIIKQSLEYNLDLTPEIFELETNNIKVTDKNNNVSYKNIIPVGLYDVKDMRFTLHEHFKNNINSTSQVAGIEKILEFCDTFHKLLHNPIIIDDKYHRVIPYLITLYNPNYNLVRFQDKGVAIKVYALVKLNIKNDIDYKSFENLL